MLKLNIMKRTINLTLLLLFSTIIYGQTMVVSSGTLIQKKNGDLYVSRGGVKNDLLLYTENCAACKKAISENTKAIGLNPNDADAYNNRAVYKICCLKDYKGAITDFNKFLKLEPDPDINVYITIASAYKSLNDFKGAIVYYDKLIKNDSTNEGVLYDRGIAQIKLGNKKSGCSDLNKAKALGNTKAEEAIEKYCK